MTAGQLLEGLDEKPERIVIADFGAGAGAMLRSNAGQVDALVIVVEPYPRSTETAIKLLEIAEFRQIRRTVLVANKIGDEADRRALARLMNGMQPHLELPADRNVARADLIGQAPIDLDPASPAMAKIEELASMLEGALSV